MLEQSQTQKVNLELINDDSLEKSHNQLEKSLVATKHASDKIVVIWRLGGKIT